MRNRLKESLPRIARLFLYVWLGAIGFFIIGVIIGANQPNQVYPKPLSDFLPVDVVVGVGAFIFMCIFALLGSAFNPEERKVGLLQSKKPKKSRASNRLSYYVAGGFVVLLIIVGFLNQRAINLENATKIKNSEIMKVTISPTPSSTPVVKGATTAKTQSDPITDCVSSHPNCNGESLRLKSRQCSKIFCCGFSDGRWELYPSEEKCKQSWAAQQPTTQAQKPSAPTNRLNFYCYDNTYKYWYYTSSGEQCNLDNANSALASICSNNVKSFGEYKNCQDQCGNAFTKDNDICYSAYTGPNPLIEDNWDLYMKCSAEVTDIFTACLDSCSPLYSKVYNECMGK